MNNRRVFNKSFGRTVLKIAIYTFLFFTLITLIKQCFYWFYYSWKSEVKIITDYVISSLPMCCVWLLILISLLCVFYFTFRKGKQIIVENKQILDEEKVLTFSDNPIEKKDTDLLNRSSFVEMLSNLILSIHNKKSARYIGVFGEWGDGKTSVCNLLRETMKNDEESPIFVAFSPWEYPEKTNLRLAFFECMANKISIEGFGELSKKFQSLSNCFFLSRLNKDIGKLDPFVDLFRILLCYDSFSQEKLTKEIIDILKEFPRKIIVVIDDLDRLPKEEVCSVFRFLKANGDLPNIIYLILADEEYLANAVAELAPHSDKPDLVRGHEYLKKIIQFPCPLPYIDGKTLLNLFKNEYVNIIESYDLDKKNAQEDYSWFLSSYLSNLRNVKQLLNAFSIKIATYKRLPGNRKYLGVHLGDLLALTVIEVFNNVLHSKIWYTYHEMLHDIDIYQSEKDGFSEGWMNEHYFRYANCDRKISEKFLKECLGVVSKFVETSSGKQKFYKLANPLNPELDRNYRLASAKTFSDYFVLERTKGHLSQEDLNSFLNTINQGQVPEEIISDLDEKEHLPELLRCLESQEVFNTKSISDCYLKTLVYMVSLPLKDVYLPDLYVHEEYWFKYNIFVRVYRCFLFYCKKIKDCLNKNERLFEDSNVRNLGDLVLPIISESSDIVISSRLIESDYRLHNSDESMSQDNFFFSNEEYDSLCKLFIERITEFQEHGKLVKHLEFYTMFRCWINLLRRLKNPDLIRRFTSACSSMTTDLEAIEKVIRFYSEDNIRTGSEILMVTIKLDFFINEFSEDGVKNILKTLETSPKLDEYTEKALIALRWALKQKEENKLHGTKEQEKYLTDYYSSYKVKSEG